MFRLPIRPFFETAGKVVSHSLVCIVIEPRVSGVSCREDTPLPISNRAVKLAHADGTSHFFRNFFLSCAKSAGESRSMPGTVRSIKKKLSFVRVFFLF